LLLRFERPGSTFQPGGDMFRRTIVLVMLCAATAVVHAQWANYPAPGIPRSKDGKPNLSAPMPRAVNGKPDLSGIWSTDPTAFEEMERLFPDLKAFAVPGDDPRNFTKYFLDIFADFRPEDVPFRPAAARLFKKHLEEGPFKGAPTAACRPAGIPMGDLLPLPRRVIHVPGLLVVLYEGVNPQRLIYTDGRKLPADPQPAWMGYSIGKWEGDVLVVETSGFSDRSWLDAIGHPRSEATRLTERLRRRDFGHMEVEVTIDDPLSYTKPFSIRYSQTLVPDTDILEYICNENEKDRAHLPGQ
jgi:hypothetical protein